MGRHIVVIEGWNEGFNKVGSTKTIRDTFGCGLKESKDYADQIMDGKVVSFEFSQKVDAQTFVERMKALGVVVRVVDEGQLING